MFASPRGEKLPIAGQRQGVHGIIVAFPLTEGATGGRIEAVEPPPAVTCENVPASRVNHRIVKGILTPQPVPQLPLRPVPDADRRILRDTRQPPPLRFAHQSIDVVAVAFQSPRDRFPPLDDLPEPNHG